MKVRTQQNFNRKTYETVFGISIMPDGGRRYCKYPIGHQEYKDYTQAYQAMKDVQKILDNGGRLVYSPKGSAGINKNEYVKETDRIKFTAYLCMKAADGTVVNGWLASQTDMLANDWMIVK